MAVRVDTGPVRIVYSTTEPVDGVAMVDPEFSGSEAVDAQGAAKVTISGLSTGTRYWWRVEENGVEDTSRTGTVLMPPPAGTASSFTFAASGDAGLGPEAPGATGTELLPDRISNSQIHKLIGQRVRNEDMLGHLFLGDILYYNFGDTPTFADDTLTDYRRGYDDLQIQPNQVSLFDSGSYIHVWDDHEFGPNDSDGTHPGKGNAAQVFREREPHHTLPDAGAIYRTWQWGRAQVVIWDCRYYRSPASDPDGPSKTMLGSTQKTWFQSVLSASTAEVIIVVSSVQWMSGGTDSWPGYATERQEIADMITASGKSGRLVMISADAHKLAIDTGGNNLWGHWPCAVFAARDASASAVSGDYDVLEQGGIGQYGTVTVTDLGSLITVKLTAWKDADEVGSYTKAFATSTPTVVSDITDLVSGSHTAVVEARVLTEFQTGDDPAGTDIPVLSGDIAYDATADIWSNFSMETAGIDETDLSSRFPRFPTDLLAPYGNEVFIRYGIPTGTETVWTPMGYYRIDDTEQRDTSDGPIRLTGPDRWQSLKDARLITPRQYQSTQTVAFMVTDLVMDVLPGAVIAWDDDTDQQEIGRGILVEEDRSAALRDLATARGKVAYFDSLGILRFETAPDPDEIVWDIAAGKNGVLVTSSRRVSREGMFNGVVARGQGATEKPALGVAVDLGEHSPTKWGSRFGKVPFIYSSPLVTDDDTGFAAAAAILQRSIGKPYSVDFGTVVNPTLRPRQATRIGQRDGNREKHLIQRLRVPLTIGQAMTGTTREQTLARIGSLLPSALPGGSE